MVEVVWSSQAAQDLEAIVEFIAKDSPQYARLFVSDIFRALDRIIIHHGARLLDPDKLKRRSRPNREPAVTAEEAVRLTRAHVERQFPKSCANCGRRFGSLADFLHQTKHLSDPVSFDEARGDKRPRDPLGVFSFANCRCGSTLSISSNGMSLLTLWRLMGWARSESKRRGVGWGQVVAWVRAEIDRQVLSEEPRPKPGR